MKGPVLIIVIMIMMMVFMFSGETSAVANLSYRQSLIRSRQIDNHYLAESRMAEGIWNLYSDIRLNKNRVIDREILEEDEAVFTADNIWRVESSEDGQEFHLKIEDAYKGFSFSGKLDGKAIADLKRNWLNEENSQDLDVLKFFDELRLYSSSSNLEKAEEYADFDMPRRAPMQYAEEVLWVPGIENVITELNEETQLNFDFSQLLAPFPPQGVKISRKNKSNFYSASLSEVILRANLQEDEVEELLEGKRLWSEERVPFSEGMPNLYSRLRKFFSFKESGVYKLSVKVTDQGAQAPVSRTVLLQLNSRGPARLGKFNGISYWEWGAF
ncbi:hypothetical protein LNTAR_12161 [Lentisphaera araneosa HTCC2155]|uniref:Type II secretion system protein K n=2 Tax=Lentisphaera TaxID=256846 RepID=A6DJN3_9BACT|nr:hypothetical protein LNTAR_12161 [Lentisphaera araneosa HTCC2155]